MTERLFGIFTGATLHEVAQVIAAGKMVSDATADAAVVAKMVRVLALGPLLLGMALWQRSASRGSGKQGQRERAGHPGVAAEVSAWFAVGFVVVMAVHSAGWVPQAWMAGLTALDNWLLACAMLAIGLHTRLGDLLRGAAAAGAGRPAVRVPDGGRRCIVRRHGVKPREDGRELLVRPTGLEPVSL